MSPDSGSPVRSTALFCIAIVLIEALCRRPADAKAAESKAPITLTAAGRFSGPIAEASRRFGILAAWIRDVMRIESRGDGMLYRPRAQWD